MVRLTQIVDRDLILSLQKRLSDELEMSIVFEESTNGEMKTIGERGKICESCTNFIDKEGKGREKCVLSDTNAAWTARGRVYREVFDALIVEFYVCNGQMRNFVIPITIGGDVLGCVYAGQFLVDKSKDKKMNLMIKKMASWGYIPQKTEHYATPPKIEDISKIARDNGILDDKELKLFIKSYKKNLDRDKLKSLEEVIEAVHLLNVIAKTISALGNAYYIKNLYVRIGDILPKIIERKHKRNLERLRDLIKQIEIKHTKDLSLKTKEINKIAYDILLAIKKYETDYINNLLIPLSNNINKNKETISANNDFEISKCKYELNKLEIIIRAASGLHITTQNILNKYLRNQEDLSEKLIQKILTLKKKYKNDIYSIIDTTDIIEKTEKIKKQFINEFKEFEEQLFEASVDEIESVLNHLVNGEYGLLKIKEKLVNQRVLNNLPSKIKQIRENLRLRYDTIYLNMGGISPTYNSVLEHQEEWAIIRDEFGPVSFVTVDELESPDVNANVLEQTRLALAKLLHCTKDEIIFTANTTHGIELSLDSMNFLSKENQEQPDEIILSNLEHETVKYCCDRISNKFNIDIKIIDLRGEISTDIVIEKISQKISNKTKIIILSHIAYNTGQILDIIKIIGKLKKYIKDNELTCCPLFLVDGAQAIGHIDVDVKKIGCDFYVADGHKWLMGPIGSGFLYVNMSYLNKNYNNFSFYKNYMVVEKYRPRKKSGKIFEPATMNIQTLIGLKAAIDYIYNPDEKDYIENYKRIKNLSQYFEKLIFQELKPFGLKLLNIHNSSGIVSLYFEGNKDIRFYEDLKNKLDQDFHIVCRNINDPPCLRFCIHFTNSQQELDIAVSSLKNLLLKNYPKFINKFEKEEKKREQEEINEKLLVSEKNDLLKKVEEEYIRYKNIAEEQFKRSITFIDRIVLRKDAPKELTKKISQLDSVKNEIISSINNVNNINELEKIKDGIDEKFQRYV